MTGASLGPRTASYGSLQQQSQKGVLHIRATPIFVRKNTKPLTSSREKEKCRHFICCHFGLRKVAVLLLVALAILVFVFGTYTGSRESSNMIIIQSIEDVTPPGIPMPNSSGTIMRMGDTRSENQFEHYPHHRHLPLNTASHMVHGNMPPSVHICAKFAFPPPPVNPKRFGPRPCPVCYLPVEQAVASMPSSPSASPVIHNLTYVLDENPIKTEPYGGSEFGGYPSLKQRNNSFDVKESMTVHCGFVKGSKPGYQTGFDIDEADLMELGQFHEVIVASAIFGNYDIIQQPKNVSELARETVPFFMFIDEETEAYLKNSSILDSSKRVGLWRIILVRNIPYMDPRRNGKIPKLLLHRIFPSVRYSIWIDGKLQLVVDPYQILERFLWRQNATFAISRHYTRYDVFEEAEANKAAGKYSNASIDSQIEFYRKEGLKPYSKTKLPITSDVPEGCVIMREHIPITNLFTCLWFNEVDRFTSRDQLSFSTVRDKIIEKAAWSINMFLDCERRNFVIQAYHRELLEHMPPPAPPRIHLQQGSGSNLNVKTSSGKKSSTRRGRERKSGSKRNRKINAGRSRDNSF